MSHIHTGDGLPASSELPADVTPHPPAPARRRRGWLVAGIVVLVAVVLAAGSAGAYLLLRGDRAEPKTMCAALGLHRIERATGDKATVSTDSPLPDEVGEDLVRCFFRLGSRTGPEQMVHGTATAQRFADRAAARTDYDKWAKVAGTEPVVGLGDEAAIACGSRDGGLACGVAVLDGSLVLMVFVGGRRQLDAAAWNLPAVERAVRAMTTDAYERLD